MILLWACKNSTSWHGASISCFLWHSRIGKLMMRSPAALTYVESDAESVVGGTHPNDRTLMSAPEQDKLPFLNAAQRYLTNPATPREKLLAHSFYATAAQFLLALRNLFTDMFCSTRRGSARDVLGISFFLALA